MSATVDFKLRCLRLDTTPVMEMTDEQFGEVLAEFQNRLLPEDALEMIREIAAHHVSLARSKADEELAEKVWSVATSGLVRQRVDRERAEAPRKAAAFEEARANAETVTVDWAGKGGLH